MGFADKEENGQAVRLRLIKARDEAEASGDPQAIKKAQAELDADRKSKNWQSDKYRTGN